MVWISEAVKRKPPARLPDERRVVVEGERRVVPALEQHRGCAARGRRRDLGEDLVDGQRVRLRVSRPAVEGAELTIGDAHVRIVRVRVDHERDGLVGDPREPDLVGEPTRLEEWRLGQEPPALVPTEPLAVERLVADLGQH